MKENINRRAWLSLCGSGAVVALAGCLGDDDGDGGTQSNTGSETGGPESDSQDTTAGAEGTGADDSDGSEEGGTDDTTVSEPISYAYEFVHRAGTRGDSATDTSSETTGFVTGDGDGYQRQRFDEGGTTGETELYIADGIGYVVTGGNCQQTALRSPDPLEDVYTNYLNAASDRGILETAVVDGQEAYVYRLTHEDTPFGSEGNLEWTATQYVGTQTGFLLRHEYESYNSANNAESETTMQFHSFGEAFTVEPPADCE